MEITYLGNASFQVRADRVVLINPAQKPPPHSIVLHSARQNDLRYVVDGPGEYEIGGILIVTAEVGPKEAPVLLHAVDMDGLNLVHLMAGGGYPLGDLSEQVVEALGKVDVLLIQALDTTAAQAAIQKLEPRVVLPFGPQALQLCEALGVREPRTETRFSWNGTTNPPQAVLLKPVTARRRAA